MNHLNLNFEGKSIAGVCNLTDGEHLCHNEVIFKVNDAVNDICTNIEQYQFDCDKCSKPHKSIHRGKVLQRIMIDVVLYDEQLLVLAILEYILDMIHERIDPMPQDLAQLLIRTVKGDEKNQNHHDN